MQLPEEIQSILQTLHQNEYEGFAVGGCVRDLLLKKTPYDWDITTNARPEKLQELFPESFYENTFGTVTIKTGSESPSLAEVQVTPYRTEAKYTDKRHPDVIDFADKLEDDLSRRDFTVNSIALGLDGELRDLFSGQIDLKKKLIRTVGAPDERFTEDALRLLRAVRFATVLDFEIEADTLASIKRHAASLKSISVERIRDELVKIVNASRAYEGVQLLEATGLLEYVLPELREGIGIEQNLHHIYTVWEHNLRALQYTAEKNYSFEVRMASLLNDVGKPATKRGEGKNCTFYGHDVVGARQTKQLMERLKFPQDVRDKVTLLVRYHMFYYNVGEVTESSVRRLLVNVGPENIEDLLKLREADRIGSGTPKAVPYKLRHLKYIIDKVSHDPISVKMLKIDGHGLMQTLGVPPGPKIGLILNSLLAEVLDDPTKNTEEYLSGRAQELSEKSPEELKEALEKIEEARQKEEEERMKKYYV